jgi:hypothetical protein
MPKMQNVRNKLQLHECSFVSEMSYLKVGFALIVVSVSRRFCVVVVGIDATNDAVAVVTKPFL